MSEQLRLPLPGGSLAPVGFVFANMRKHLEQLSPDVRYLSSEYLLAQLWEEWNGYWAARPLPIQFIVHNLLPGFSTRNRLRATDADFLFEGQPYLYRDLLLLSNTVQWFGTNNGRSFLLFRSFGAEELPGYHRTREFVWKLKHEAPTHHAMPGLLLSLTHECVDECGQIGLLTGIPVCKYAPPTARDEALLYGLMHWLGMNAGRAFIETFAERNARAQSVLRAQRRLRR